MITLYLNPKEKKSLYEQLYEHIKKMIIAGYITFEEKLPSKRKLSNHLKVSLSTIENAYTQLIAEGYVKPIEKKGYFVAYNKNIVLNKPNEINEQFKEITTSKEVKFALHTKTNVVDASLFPMDLWVKLQKKISTLSKDEIINHVEPKGVDMLRHEIKAYLEAYRGIFVDIKQIILGAGSEVLLSLIADVLGHQKHIGIENPSYHKIFHILSNKHDVYPINLDEEGMCIDELYNHNVDMIHITPSHQFPSGVVMPITRRMDLLNWAYQHTSRLIIEDDYDSEFRFVGQPIEALYALDHHGQVIYINSFSKSLGPSMRLSYMVIPKRLLNMFDEKLKYYRQTVSNIFQYHLAFFMQDGAFYRHINKMRVKYKQKRDYLIEALKSSVFKDDFVIENADAGLHFILKHKKIDASTFSKNAEDFGLKIDTLSESLHKTNDAFKNGLIIGYAHLTFKEIDELVLIIEKVCSFKK